MEGVESSFSCLIRYLLNLSWNSLYLLNAGNDIAKKRIGKRGSTKSTRGRTELLLLMKIYVMACSFFKV